jgi:hypothetical protein
MSSTISMDGDDDDDDDGSTAMSYTDGIQDWYCVNHDLQFPLFRLSLKHS